MRPRLLPRTLTAAMMVIMAASLTLAGAVPASAHDFDRPHQGFAPARTVLRTGTPESVGLRSEPIQVAREALHAYEQPTADRPALFPGAVAVLGHDGRIVATDVSGYARLYADASSELPQSERIPMREDTIFDLASVSKLFTSLAVVQLIEKGKVDLDAPVARYLPEFAGQGKQDTTVRNLLTHTSGLPAWLPLWSQYPDRASRIKAVMEATPTDAPDAIYRYSDLNLITLGVLVERVTGDPLDEVVADRITKPLGMHDTGYNPLSKNPALRQRIAATEYQATPPRGIVWGEVHDENAWSLGGVAGHAGVFSTAGDLSILSQALLNGGTYRHHRILRRASVELLITNFNTAFPGDDHGLGFELNQRWYAEGLSGPREAGHTGFTGTSLVIDFASRSFAILLTNRVHPSRNNGSINPARRAWAQGLALAMPVEPRRGEDAWFTGVTNATTATLDLPLTVPASGADLRFAAFVDTEETDPLVLETSRDGGQTWQPLPFTVAMKGQRTKTDGTWAQSGVRSWASVTAELGGGAQIVRWRHTTDALYLGRGVYVDDVRVRAGRWRFDGERDPDAFTAVNWQRSGH